MVLTLALWVAVWAGIVPADAAPTYPALTGQIVDQANLLTPEDRASILSDLQALEGKSTDQVAVVTVTSLEGLAIEDYSIGLARQWKIGQKDKDNGVILLVAPNERKVRIEVGRRLEPILTDTMSFLIINNAILPRFRRGDFSGGIRAAVTDIKDVLLGDAEAMKERAKVRTPEDQTPLLHFMIFIAVVILIVWMSQRAQRRMEASMTPEERRRARRRPGGIVIIPGGSSDWGGGWSGGGGGGWSGGGGDFGGGGSSGSW